MSAHRSPDSDVDFLGRGGEMGALIRAHDWAATPLGPPHGWPQALRTALRLVLNTRHPMYVFWGAERLCFYNDAYNVSIGPELHPSSLGRPAETVWAEIWPLIGPQIAQVMRGGEATWHENHLVPITRNGRRDNVYWTYSYGPIDDPEAPNGVGGTLVVCTETTNTVLAEKRRAEELRQQRRLFEQAPGFIAVMQGPQHTVEFVNDAHRRIFGSADWLGKPIRDAFPDIAEQGFFERLDAVYASGEPYHATGAPARFRTAPHGAEQTRMLDFIYAPLFGADGAVTGVFCEGLDVTDRLAADAVLRESEARFGAVANAAPVLIYMTDETSACTWFNKTWLAFTGRSMEQERGFGWADGVHPADREQCLACYNDAFERRQPFRMDYRLRRHDGAWRTVDDNGVPRFADDGCFLGYVGSCVDVTQQRATEAALRASEQQLRLATDVAEVGLWDVDTVTDTLYWSARVKAMFGISEHVHVSMADFYAGLHPEDSGRTAAAYAAAADPAQRLLYEVEYRTVGKEDGIVRWVAAKGRGVFDGRGRCVRLIGTAIDITRRKNTEQRLRQTQSDLAETVAELDRLNTTLETQVAERTAELDRVWRNARDLLVVVGADGRFRAVSPSWTAILGHPASDVVGQPFAAFVWPDAAPAGSAPALQQAGGATGLAGQGAAHFDQRCRHQDGTPRWIAWSTSVEGGLVFASGRDITADKSKDEALAAAELALRQAQKMEAIGQLTGGIAHDFNNLLQSVASSFDLIRRRPEDAAASLRWAQSGLRAVDRGARLTAQLLAFSRSQQLEMKPLVISELVGNMRDLLTRTLGPAVRLSFDLQTAGLRVLGDETQLEMALLNLAINARDAMPDGGALTVTTVRETVEGDPELADGDHVLLRVSDTGTGMTPEVAARALDPFFTTKDVGKGTGLGLSQVYGMIRQAKGTVRIQSRPGRGTTVCLYLPCTRLTQAGPGGTTAAASVAGHAAAATVLVVDDDPEVRQLLVDLLGELGYRTVQADGGLAGLAVLDRTTPDAMIVDFAMPGITGAEVARLARARLPRLPIVFASGFAETAALHDVPGPLPPLLRKPFQLAELQAVLAALLRDAGAALAP